jgi:hypothetical protein
MCPAFSPDGRYPLYASMRDIWWVKLEPILRSLWSGPMPGPLLLEPARQVGLGGDVVDGGPLLLGDELSPDCWMPWAPDTATRFLTVPFEPGGVVRGRLRSPACMFMNGSRSRNSKGPPDHEWPSRGFSAAWRMPPPP